ncbi:hypothetical protein [Herpetosiphon geysericola]|uniref:hypothetical protein n=1 Tax=Herpetosiphon geysericola TaxID=70996 RepID=UPI00128F131D|nr:hypothetical protein [Herpetosiphon geysericola]
MTTIVPFVVLATDNAALRKYRREIEINEAREVIYSHHTIEPLIDNEVALIRELLDKHVIYMRYGTSTPSLPSKQNHNIQIARRMYQQQKSVLRQRIRIESRD